MKCIFKIFILLSLNNSYSQDIIDIFYAMPSKYLDELNYLEKKKIINEESINIDDRTYSIEFDKKNGYLRLEQSYTGGQSGYQIFEICYWKYNNKKIIALSSVAGSNGGFHQNDFKFFEYSDNKLGIINYGVFKEYSLNIEILMNNIVSKLCKKNVSKQVKEDKLRFAGLTFELPKKGKNIIISFKGTGIINDDYLKYVEKDRYEYFWIGNGKFK